MGSGGWLPVSVKILRSIASASPERCARAAIMVIAAWPAASRGQRGRRTVSRPDGPEDAFDLSGLTALMPDGGDENRNRRFESGLRLAGEIALEVDGSGESARGSDTAEGFIHQAVLAFPDLPGNERRRDPRYRLGKSPGNTSTRPHLSLRRICWRPRSVMLWEPCSNRCSVDGGKPSFRENCA